MPESVRVAQWAEANRDNLVTQRGLLFRCTHCATGKGRLTRQINALLVPQGLRNRILQLAHSHPVFGHKGSLATYQQLKSSYYWPTMKRDVAEFIRKCSFCQGKNRRLNPVPPRVRPLPSAPFSVISVNHARPFGIPVHGLRGPKNEEEERREGYIKGRRYRFLFLSPT